MCYMIGVTGWGGHRLAPTKMHIRITASLFPSMIRLEALRPKSHVVGRL